MVPKNKKEYFHQIEIQIEDIIMKEIELSKQRIKLENMMDEFNEDASKKDKFSTLTESENLEQKEELIL